MRILKLIPAVLLTFPTYGHPGHDHYQENIVLHYISSPIHFIPILLLFATIALIILKIKQVKEFIKSILKK